MVRSGPLTLLTLVSVVFGMGCRAAQLGQDQADMRQTLLHLYQDQVLDNLVRTKLKLPIAQVDYSNLTGTLSQTVSATAGQTETKTNNVPAKNATGSLLDTVRAYALNYSGTGSEVGQLTVTGQPVINSDAVYTAYVNTLKQHPEIIQEATSNLKPEAVHLKYYFWPNRKTYYVPAANAADFFDLYLVTTVKRQGAIALLAFRTKVVGILKIKQLSNTQSLLDVKLVDKVLADSGRFTVSVKGVLYSFRYQPPPGANDGEAVDHVLVNDDETVDSKLSGADLAKEIEGKDVTLHGDTYAPGYVAPAPDQLEAIRSQLEQQRLQQISR